MYPKTTQILTRLVTAALLFLGQIFQVFALPVCEADRFKCFLDCCKKGTWFCNESPLQERCQHCSLRQTQCGTTYVHQNCLLYCQEYMQRNATTPPLTSPTTSTELPQTTPDLAAGASTERSTTIITSAAAVIGLVLLGTCLCCICKRYLPQSWMTWLKDRTATFSPARRNRPEDTYSTNGEQASGSQESTRQPLLNVPSTNTSRANLDETQSQLLTANPSQIEDAGDGQSTVIRSLDDPNFQRPTESAGLVGRTVEEEDRVSTPGSPRSTPGSHDGESLSAGSTHTTESVHAPPGASARPPSTGSDLSNDDSQATPPSGHSSSNDGSPPESRREGTKGKPDFSSEQQGGCRNGHRCSQTINNNINITSGGHCSGCPGNGCGRESPPGAHHILTTDHDVADRRSGAGQNVFSGGSPNPYGSSVHTDNGPNVQPPRATPDHRFPDARLYTTATPDNGDQSVVLAATGLLADDRQMNIKRRPDDGPEIPSQNTPSAESSS